MGDTSARVYKKTEKRVAFLGHSFVAFKRKPEGGGKRQGYVEMLNQNSSGVRFTGYGKSDDTTVGILRRIKKIPLRRYDVLGIYAGVNDLRTFRRNPNWLEKIEGNLKQMIKIAAEKGIKRILLVEVSPWGGYVTWNKELGKRTLELNRMLGKLASDPEIAELGIAVEVVEVFSGMKREGRDEVARLKEEFVGRKVKGGKDYLHPSYEGFEYIAERIAEKCNVMLSKEKVPREQNVAKLRKESTPKRSRGNKNLKTKRSPWVMANR